MFIPSGLTLPPSPVYFLLTLAQWHEFLFIHAGLLHSFYSSSCFILLQLWSAQCRECHTNPVCQLSPAASFILFWECLSDYSQSFVLLRKAVLGIHVLPEAKKKIINNILIWPKGFWATLFVSSSTEGMPSITSDLKVFWCAMWQQSHRWHNKLLNMRCIGRWLSLPLFRANKRWSCPTCGFFWLAEVLVLI